MIGCVFASRMNDFVNLAAVSSLIVLVVGSVEIDSA